jgi:hypothetical protein
VKEKAVGKVKTSSQALDRRSIVVGLLAAGAAHALGGCTRAVVTNSKAIVEMATAVLALLQEVRALSEVNAKTVQVEYAGLATTLKGGTVSSPEIQHMERTLASFRSQSGELKAKLSATTSKAHEFFDMLEKRTKESQSTDLRATALARIEAKRLELDQRLERANAAVAKLDAPIQKYDDILNYVQVNQGLGTLDTQLAEIDRVASDAARLSVEVNTAVAEGLVIVHSLDIAGVPRETMPALATVTTPPAPVAPPARPVRPAPPASPSPAPTAAKTKAVAKEATVVSGAAAPKPGKKVEAASPKAASLPGEVL